ncbi:MAG: EI24 domain-containing protein [Planctomycetes bacterium]|nr:EI24 domain-containing protein [Planctomycetota bacterium]
MTTSDLSDPTGVPVGGPVPPPSPDAGGPAPAPKPELQGPQEALRERRQVEARGRAARALEAPIAPELGVRCPRCGQRLAAKGAPRPATCSRCGVEVDSPRAGELLVPAAPWTRELLRGAMYLPRGFFRLLRSPSLWKWAVVPLILNIIAVVISLWLASFIAQWLTTKTGAGALNAWEQAGWLWWALSYVVWALGWVASKLVWIVMPIISTWLIVAFPFGIIYKLIFMPFMELMTESTERIVLGFDEDQPFDFTRMYTNLILAVIDAIALTLMQGLLYLLLLPINVLPFLGSVLWFVLPPAIFAGMDYSDINLVRRRYSLREKFRLWRTHEWRFLGYGISFFLLITTPVINVVAIPCAAVGGALLYLELDRK